MLILNFDGLSPGDGISLIKCISSDVEKLFVLSFEYSSTAV